MYLISKNDINWISLILALLVLLVVFCFLSAEKISNNSYIAFLLFLIISLIFLTGKHRETQIFCLLLIVLLSFTFYYYFMVICYSYSSVQKGSFKDWNDSMKNLLTDLYSVEVIGRKDYNEPVIYALLNNHNYSFLEHFSYGLLEDNIAVVIRKGYLGIQGQCDNFIPVTFDGGNSDSFYSGCMKKIKNNQSIAVYPEGKNAVKKRKKMIRWRKLSELQSGVFRFSFSSGVKIVSVITEADLCPGYLLFPGKFRIHLLDTLDPRDFEDWEEMKKEYRRVMEKKLKEI